jgi:hypothetical protein
MAFLNKRKYIGSEMNEKYVDIINRRLSKLSLFVNQREESTVVSQDTGTVEDVSESDEVAVEGEAPKMTVPRFTYMGKNYFPGDLFTVGGMSYNVKSRGVIPRKIKDIIDKPVS